MKLLDIALKDLLRSFRSSFLLVMMFVAPLLITGLIYFAFGSMAREEGELNLSMTRVQVVNLDQPDPSLGFAAGQMLVDYLQEEALAAVLEVTAVSDEAGARAAVDRGAADVAVIIPANLTAAVEAPDLSAGVTLYHDPTQTLGPGIVKTLVGDFIDGFVGAKITVEVAHDQLSARGLGLDAAAADGAAQRYVAWIRETSAAHQADAASPMLVIRAPLDEKGTANPQTVFLGPVMAGMMIFFVFFTGAATAQSIIYEDEEGTLARLFTTPTSRLLILGGKFVAVLVTLLLQALVLMLVSSFLFHIRWGAPLTAAVVTLGLVIAASGFGILLMSWVKTTRQAGPILGSVVTITGILGGLIPTGDPSQPSPLETLSLTMPQGWALRGWKLALSGAGFEEVIGPVAVLLGVGLAFFVIGGLIFRRRFA
jgi:ABC-2 type transport system permease protein